LLLHRSHAIFRESDNDAFAGVVALLRDRAMIGEFTAKVAHLARVRRVKHAQTVGNLPELSAGNLLS
jgi:hypothetical protein